MKATDPSVVVLSSGLAALTPTLLEGWLDAFFTNQPKPRFDWFGWHPYGLIAGAGPDAERGMSWVSVEYHGGDGDFGLYTDAGEQRISFAAFRTFVALTAGWRFETRERGTDDGSAPEVYRFASPSGRRLWMVYAPLMRPGYTAIEPHPVALQLAPGEIATLVERDGARREVTANAAGRLVVSATSQPTYVVEP